MSRSAVAAVVLILLASFSFAQRKADLLRNLAEEEEAEEE